MKISTKLLLSLAGMALLALAGFIWQHDVVTPLDNIANDITTLTAMAIESQQNQKMVEFRLKQIEAELSKEKNDDR